MSNPDFNLCDVCGGRVPKDARFFVATGSEMDGAGSSDTVGEHLDLCLTHAVEAIKHLTCRQPRIPDFDQGIKLVGFIRGRKKK